MSQKKDGQARGKYTLEIKMEAVRLVKGGKAVPVTAKILGVPTCRPAWLWTPYAWRISAENLSPG